MGWVRFDRPLHTALAAPRATVSEKSLVSVVMTCFNTSEWVENAAASIIDQRGWENFELIIVDDGSTDETFRIASRLAKQDSRVRPFQLPRNLGTYRAKNIGMSISRGELITFMDSDDTSHPDRLSEQAHLLMDPDLIACTCNYVRVTPSEQIIPMGGLKERQALISLMFKRPVLGDIGWFDSVRTSADDEFFERIRFVYGRHAHHNISKVLYRALHRAGSLSAGKEAPMSLDAGNAADTLSPPRRAYVQSYRCWYADLERRQRRPYMPFNIVTSRAFPAPPELILH